MTIAIAAFGVWWVSSDGSPSWWLVVSLLSGMAMGTFVGVIISGRDWWLGPVPLVAFSVVGYLLSSRFSESKPFDDGDYTEAAYIALAGISAGILGTITLLLTVALRGLVTGIVRRRRPVA
ncbi:MAG: hypothetical protein QOJ13_1907 [Gaiellales bacterium]|nr:hypothetical protein [Gaiellales bacterium]